MSLVKNLAVIIVSDALQEASKKNMTIQEAIVERWKEYLADPDDGREPSIEKLRVELHKLGFTLASTYPQKASKSSQMIFYFNLQQLLGDSIVGERLNHFDFENLSINGLVVNVVGESGTDGDGGIWDAGACVHTKRGLLEVEGWEGASGTGGIVIAQINPMGEVISQIIKSKDKSYFTDFTKPLHFHDMFVEAKDAEAAEQIKNVFGDAVYQE